MAVPVQTDIAEMQDRLNNSVRTMKKDVIAIIKEAIASGIHVAISVDRSEKVHVARLMWQGLGYPPSASNLIGVSINKDFLRTIKTTPDGIEIPYELLAVYISN